MPDCVGLIDRSASGLADDWRWKRGSNLYDGIVLSFSNDLRIYCRRWFAWSAKSGGLTMDNRPGI